jgi:hypothetical protein
MAKYCAFFEEGTELLNVVWIIARFGRLTLQSREVSICTIYFTSQ